MAKTVVRVFACLGCGRLSRDPVMCPDCVDLLRCQNRHPSSR